MQERETRSPVLWDPFAELEPFVRWPYPGFARPPRAAADMWGPGRGFTPAVDVTEDEGHYRVNVELPGTKKDDATVELHQGVLTIRGEKRREREDKDEQHRHLERRFGTFSRSFSLPPDADGEHIKASFEEGVLSVEVRKAAQAKPQKVEISG